MKQLGEVLLVPIQNKVEMWVAGELASVKPIIVGKDLHFSEFKLKILHHDGMIAVVIEEKYVALMFKAVSLICYIFCYLHTDGQDSNIISKGANVDQINSKQNFIDKKTTLIVDAPLIQQKNSCWMILFIQMSLLSSYLYPKKKSLLHQFKPIQLTKMELTPKAVQKMLRNEAATNQLLIVEGKRVGKSKGTFISLYISDGETTARAIVDSETCGKCLLAHIHDETPLRLMIHEFTTHKWQRKKIVEINGLTILEPTQNIKKEQSQLPSEIKLQKAIYLNFNSHLKVEHKSINPPQLVHRQRKLNIADSDQETKPFQAPDSEIDIKSFEKIEDLYPGLYGWEILVRVIDKSYRQFTSKLGNEVKILDLQFIDRTGYTIQGVMFGLQAELAEKKIQKGSVYRVSRGKLEELRSKKKHSQKKSPYSIKFYVDSSIVEVKDIPEIPYCSNNWIRLSQLTAEDGPDEVFNVVGILLEIGEEKVFPRDERMVVMQNIKVGDPISSIIIDAVIWGRQITLDQSFLNKTVELKSFKVTNYKENINLSSTFRSQIIRHNLFQEYEDNWFPTSRKDQGFGQYFKTLQDLSHELKDLKESETIKSTINVWVSSLCFGMKWFYESCPNSRCKKAAIPFTHCQYCSSETWECVKRFSLTIELSDFTGSIFVTAFEEPASIFLKGLQIEYLSSLSQSQLKAIGQKLSYQNYKIVIISKFDNQNKIKHSIIGKPELTSLQQQCKGNLALIRQMKQRPVYLQIYD